MRRLLFQHQVSQHAEVLDHMCGEVVRELVHDIVFVAQPWYGTNHLHHGPFEADRMHATRDETILDEELDQLPDTTH